MFKKRKKSKKTNVKIIGIIFSLLILSMGVGYSYLEQNLSLVATARIKVNQSLDYKITYQVQVWGTDKTTYQFNPLTMKYKGNEQIYGWNIIIDVPSDATVGNCWSSNCRIEAGKLYITNDLYNGFIYPDASINIGFEIITAVKNYDLNVEEVQFYSNTSPHPNEHLVYNCIDVNIGRGNGWADIVDFTIELRNACGVNLNYWEIGLKKSNLSEVSSLWGSAYIEKDELLILTGQYASASFLSNEVKNIGIHMKSNDNNLELVLDYIHGRTIE